MIYKFRTGNVFKGIDAQTAGEELERIRVANDGRLETDDLLEKASDPKSPLHPAFTWDDAKAAHEHRLGEARYLIRNVVVMAKEGQKPQPAFWNVSVTSLPQRQDDAGGHYYQSHTVIASDPQEYQGAVNLVLRQIASAQSSLKHLRSLAPRRDRMNVKTASGHVESANKVLSKLTK